MKYALKHKQTGELLYVNSPGFPLKPEDFGLADWGKVFEAIGPGVQILDGFDLVDATDAKLQELQAEAHAARQKLFAEKLARQMAEHQVKELTGRANKIGAERDLLAWLLADAKRELRHLRELKTATEVAAPTVAELAEFGGLVPCEPPPADTAGQLAKLQETNAKQLETLRQLQAELEQLKADHGREGLADQLADAKSELESNRGVATFQLGQLRAVNRELERERDALREQLAAEKARADGIARDRDVVAEHYGHVSQNAGAAAESLAQLQQELSDTRSQARDELGGAQLELDELRGLYAGVQLERDQLKAERDQLARQIELYDVDLRATQAERDAEAQARTGRVTELEQERDELLEANRLLIDEREQAIHQRDQLAEQLRQVERPLVEP